MPPLFATAAKTARSAAFMVSLSIIETDGYGQNKPFFVRAGQRYHARQIRR
jgi:hypothetical protein